METEHSFTGCPICLEDITFKKNQAGVVIKTACDHYYHYQCWKKHWDTGNDVKIQCPMCRQRLNYNGADLPDKEYIELLEQRMLFLLVSVNNEDGDETNIRD